MTYHPLHEFISLLEDKGLTKLLNHFDDHEAFIERRQFNDAEVDLFYVCFVEWDNIKSCYIMTELRSSDEPNEKLITKENYISEILEGASRRFKTRVRSNYLNLDGKEIKNKSDVLIKELNHIRQTIPQEYQEVNEIIGSHLKALISFLKGYSDDPKAIINDNNTRTKLKWLGKINTLVTLFWELEDGSNNLKKRFLKEDRQTLKKFICDNFVDENGNDLTEITIYTILSKTDKRSKYSFELKDSVNLPMEDIDYDERAADMGVPSPEKKL